MRPPPLLAPRHLEEIRLQVPDVARRDRCCTSRPSILAGRDHVVLRAAPEPARAMCGSLSESAPGRAHVAFKTAIEWAALLADAQLPRSPRLRARPARADPATDRRRSRLDPVRSPGRERYVPARLAPLPTRQLDRHQQPAVLVGRALRRRSHGRRDDRLFVHHAETLALRGDSYRLDDNNSPRPGDRPLD